MKKTLMTLLLLPLLLCLALPTQAAEKFKDFLFKGMPDYEIGAQTRNFEQLEIKSPKPESKNFVETTYEGNRVYSRYNYRGDETVRPSDLQVKRYFQSAVNKLGGEVLFESDSQLHASFKRNDKQYYMVVKAGGRSAIGYELWILELAELDYDVEIIDSDTILHKLDKEGHIALYINFDTGLATIKPESKDVIDEIVTALKSKPQLKVKLEGHTDNVGNAAANKKLSDDRANAVMNAISAKGIDKTRLSAEGFGLDKPIADNDSEAGRAKNRRVELVKMP
ncbi:hypothetical protein AGMMS50256_25580 [Betaproteobacteria bacterium]|nr:hypothetical protein AGMMS50256_25580 [Betaproteobacteria bacterium]